MSEPFHQDRLSDAPGQQWLGAMEKIADEDGYLEPLGPAHLAFFAESGPKLLVVFDQAEAIRSREDHLPPAWALARAEGWSFLCVIAARQSFWRAREVWGYFDRLSDDGFFDDFDQVLFYGAASGGYAAASYMLAAPGASALLIAPRATLSPELAGWDPRHRSARRLDFTSRYGFAPDMTGGAAQVWLIADPMNPPDAAHAALFARPWVTRLKARWTAERSEKVLIAAGILPVLLREAMAGTLNAPGFSRLWRRRRGVSLYLRALMEASLSRGRPGHEVRICRYAAQSLGKPRFLRRLAEIESRDAPPKTSAGGRGA